MGEKTKCTQGSHGQEKFCWEFFWRKAQDTDEEKVGREGETPSHFGISAETTPPLAQETAGLAQCVPNLADHCHHLDRL